MIEQLPPRYSVRERIGSGGMGQVYRALDTKLGRDVAVKLLPPDLAHDRERLDRLRREARVLAHLGHANIAAIYDLEETDGHTYLILEFVPGTTLASDYDVLIESDRVGLSAAPAGATRERFGHYIVSRRESAVTDQLASAGGTP